jgi:hypothetical protein
VSSPSPPDLPLPLPTSAVRYSAVLRFCGSPKSTRPTPAPPNAPPAPASQSSPFSSASKENSPRVPGRSPKGEAWSSSSDSDSNPNPQSVGARSRTRTRTRTRTNRNKSRTHELRKTPSPLLRLDILRFYGSAVLPKTRTNSSFPAKFPPRMSRITRIHPHPSVPSVSSVVTPHWLRPCHPRVRQRTLPIHKITKYPRSRNPSPHQPARSDGVIG